MDVGRKAEGGEALMCLTVDTEVARRGAASSVAGEIEAHQLRTVTLHYRPAHCRSRSEAGASARRHHEAEPPDHR